MEAKENSLITITNRSSRLKREDCRRTKHGFAFHPWKILVGPSDWEDHSNGKEGAERYRTQNLPDCTSCSGVYELGIALCPSKTGRGADKLSSKIIVPVYIGKSETVRNRLQQYGREGAHLENGSSDSKLFSDMFSRGYCIVYRWAPMRSIRDADKAEADLLHYYDYAWNRGSNGPRRPNDILKKVDAISKTSTFMAKLQGLTQRKMGINSTPCEPFMNNGLNFFIDSQTKSLLHRIFKFGTSRPKLVKRSPSSEDYTSICGVALGHGVICKLLPVSGNKRCLQHKGMKINGSGSNLLTDGKSTLVANEDPLNKNSAADCGFILNDGSSCTRKPVQGNKRCMEHKGRKVCNYSQQIKDKKEDFVYGPVFPSKAGKQYIHSYNSSKICGKDLNDATFCTRQPPPYRKRCDEHKGMRIKDENPSLSKHSGHKSGIVKSQNHSIIPSVFCDDIHPICGATTLDGSPCSRKPTEGNKRCYQHKGMRAGSSASSSSNSKSYANSYHDATYVFRYENFSSYHNTSYVSSYEKISSTCGATTRGGLPCRRRTSGGGRCYQHGG